MHHRLRLAQRKKGTQTRAESMTFHKDTATFNTHVTEDCVTILFVRPESVTE